MFPGRRRRGGGEEGSGRGGAGRRCLPRRRLKWEVGVLLPLHRDRTLRPYIETVRRDCTHTPCLPDDGSVGVEGEVAALRERLGLVREHVLDQHADEVGRGRTGPAEEKDFTTTDVPLLAGELGFESAQEEEHDAGEATGDAEEDVHTVRHVFEEGVEDDVPGVCSKFGEKTNLNLVNNMLSLANLRAGSFSIKKRVRIL